MIVNHGKKQYLAHVRKTDKATQTLATHLLEVAEITKQLATKINVPEAGELIGLLHDFGKYSADFQNYIQSGTELLDPDLDDDFVDAVALKGKIDHSTAGAQWLWQALSKYGKNGEGKLFSCLINADRINSANFDNPVGAANLNYPVSLDIAINLLVLFLTEQQAKE